MQGIKNIQISARCSYPIISAYEFEFLKTEAEVKALLKPCTIYFIVQRPLIYFNNICITKDLISFEITDRTSSKPLICSFSTVSNGFSKEDEELIIEFQFYKSTPDKCEPFNDVAGLKLIKTTNEFLLWLTPQKFIHHILTNRLNGTIDGDINRYIDYKIHYIGQSFSQDVWNRLTGHEKMQSILTLEHPIDSKTSMASFEISLIMLDIKGFTEGNIFPYSDIFNSDGVSPIFHELSYEEDDDSFEKFFTTSLALTAPELTNEIEAMLIKLFDPTYNVIKFKNYPNIAKGTRSLGYTESTLFIEELPAILYTDNYKQNAIIPK